MKVGAEAEARGTDRSILTGEHVADTVAEVGRQEEQIVEPVERADVTP